MKSLKAPFFLKHKHTTTYGCTRVSRKSEKIACMIEWRLQRQTTDKSDEYAVSLHSTVVSPRIFGSEPIYTTLCILYSVHMSLGHSSFSFLYYTLYRIKSFQHLNLNPIFRCWTHLRGSFNYLSAFLLI